MILPTDIGIQLDQVTYPSPAPITFTPAPSESRTTGTTTYVPQTLGDRFAQGPTPPVMKCTQFCEDLCEPLRWSLCVCASEYAVPVREACRVSGHNVCVLTYVDKTTD